MAVRDTSMIHKCMKTLSSGAILKMPLVCAAISIGIKATAADEWTGGAAGTTEASFGEVGNWLNNPASVPSGDISFTAANIIGAKTVTFDNAYSFGGNLHVYAGTEKSPLVFKASGSNGFAATENKEMYIGNGADNPAYVVLDGGTYTFMNDLTIGQNHADSTLVVKEGARVQLPHWTKIGAGSGTGESRLVIDGGEYVGGWRNDEELDNARFAIAEGTESKAIVTMNAGRIRASGGNSAGDWAFVVGTGPRSEGRFIANDGTLDVANGRIIVAGGNTATGVVEKTAGTWTAGNDLRVAEGASSEGLLVHSGGETTVGSWLHAGIGANSHGKVVLSGGTISIPNSSCNATFGYASGALGELEMTGGNLTVKNEVYLGGQASATGTVHVTGGEITSGGRFYVGRSGQSGACGMLTVDGGMVGTSNDFRIGDNGTVGIVTNNSGTITVGINFTVGAESTGRGEYVQNGGTNTVAKYGFISRNGGTGYMEMNGGLMTFGEPLVVGSNGSAGRMKMTGGMVSIPNSPLRFNDSSYPQESAPVESELLLKGGVLSCKRIETNNSGVYTKAYLTLDGGTIAPNQAGQNFLVADDKIVVRVGAKGGTIDTGSIYVSGFTHEIVSALEEDETDGGLTIIGKGILPMMGAAKYTGETFVKSGVLAITNGYSFAGPVKVGKNGAIAVDITAANTASELSVGSKIALFSFKGNAVGFDETTDTLDTSVFLTGPVVGYALSQETAEGVTTVYARITDVSNIAKTRKVTTFISGPLSEGGDRHVDQDTAFSNKMPGGDGFDVVVFPGDALMQIWTKGNDRRYRAHGDLVVRGGTVWVKINNNDLDHSPRLGARHIAGNGTLKLTQVGLEAVDNMNGTLVVEPTVNIDFTCHESKPTYDTWITGHSAVDINGDVYVTNGVMRVYSGVVFNGDVIIGAWDTMSYLNDPATFNGRLVVQEGATFNFNDKAVTFGENATIVLGGEIVNYGNVQSWPKTVIEKGFYVYGTAPIANTNCTVKGGLLRVSPTKGDNGDETLDLSGITIPVGVNPEDVLVVTDTEYNWTLSVDQATRRLTATRGESKTADDANVWYGGAEGDLSVAQNWTRGVPTATQIVKFIADAVVERSDNNQTQYWKELVIENNARVELKSNDGNWPNYIVPADGISGNGTLVLRRCGLKAVDNNTDFTIPATITLVTCNNGGSATANDSWLNDHNATATITVNGSVTNENYFITRGYVVFNDDVTVKNGAKFEIQGQTTFNKKLVFTNGGTLALNGANTSVVFGEAAAIEVLAGTVSVPRSTLADGRSVSLSDGAGMLINMNGEDEPVEDNVAICLGVAFSGDAAKVSFSDSRAWDWTASVGQDGKLYATPKSTYQNHWIGGESGLWSSDANWEFGIPKMTECAVFTNSATATATDKGAHKMDKLIIESGKTVTLTAQTKDNWPQWNMTEFQSGGGDLVVGFGGLESSDNRAMALNGNITLANDGTRDAFIKAASGRVTINGKLTITGESTDARILGENNMEVNGEVAINTSASKRNVQLRRVKINGNLTGSGYLQFDSDGKNCDKQCSLYGDNRDFHGRIDKISDNGCTLGGPNAAGTNIEWHVTGDLHLVAENDQVWKFGALNFDWTDWNVCYITKGKSITLEVGSLGQDMTFKNAYKFWGEGANTDITVTIRKVGAGKLTTGAYNYKYLIVEAGEVALEKPTAFDNRNFKNITGVSVAAGATISGYPGTHADGGMYIEALTLAPGAIVKETLVATTENEVTTYSCPVLTATGDVNVSGVKFVLDDPDGHLTSSVYDESNVEKFTVLQANAVTGRPASDVIAKMATGNRGWRAFVEGGNKVVVKPATKRIVILIR